MMQTKELRAKSISELQTEMKTLLKKLQEVSREVMGQKEKNVRLPRKIRKEIARSLGVIKEKQILEGTAGKK